MSEQLSTFDKEQSEAGSELVSSPATEQELRAAQAAYAAKAFSKPQLDGPERRTAEGPPHYAHNRC